MFQFLYAFEGTNNCRPSQIYDFNLLESSKLFITNSSIAESPLAVSAIVAAAVAAAEIGKSDSLIKLPHLKTLGRKQGRLGSPKNSDLK